MKVTVALITYNRPKYLSKAINAILNQTYTDFEFLILDNGSTDETMEVISQFKDNRIRYIRNEKNQIEFYNKPFTEALGKYLLITHDDDMLLPDLLRKEVETMDNFPDSIIVSCNACTIDEYDNIINPNLLKLKSMHIFEKYQFLNNIIRGKNGLVCPTALLRKDFFLSHEYQFDFTVGPAADNYLWIKCNLLDETIIIIPEILYKYRIHAKQDSQINLIPMQTKFYESLLVLFSEEKLYDILPIFSLRLIMSYADSLQKQFISKIEFIEKINQLNLPENKLYERLILKFNKFGITKITVPFINFLKIQNRIRIIFFKIHYQ